jgi:hypothetical protein
MERIKLAILKAKENADQRRPDQSRAAPPGTEANGAGGFSEPRRRSRNGVAWLFVVLALVITLWFLRVDRGAASTPAAMRVAAAPEPPFAVVSSVQAAEPAVAPDPDQVVAAVEVWRRAWTRRDMVGYLGSYSDAFTPSDGATREDWVASRHRNVGGRKSVDVQINGLQVVAQDADRARVSFLQDYTSGNRRESAQRKTLDLVREADGRWRIVGEWQGDSPPAARAGES